MLMIGGCASGEAVVGESDVVAAPVTSTELARLTGLHAAPIDSFGQVILRHAASAERISLFPGTTIAVIRGQRITTELPIERVGDEAVVSADDADRIRAVWGARTPLRARTAPPVHVHVGSGDPNAGLPPPLGARPPRTPRRAPTVAKPTNAPTTRELRAWRVPLKRRWRYIVVHHSATAAGSAASFDTAHKKRRWDGLGYDFVIGNGRGAADGLVEVGFRWKQQRDGAHAGNKLMNQTGIGICLVGDFTKSQPTTSQMRSLKRLTDFLSAYCGIPPQNLRRHSDFRETICPGPLFPKAFGFDPMPGVTRGAVLLPLPR